MKFNSPKAVAGFTLLELLIALALSGLLSAAIVRIVLGNKQNVLLADSYAKVQESARYALDYLARDFRMAGYMGCVNTNLASGKITNLLKSSDSVYKAGLHSYNEPIRAIDNYDAGTAAHVTAFENALVPAAINGTLVRPVEDTDVFITSSAVATDLLSSVAHGVGDTTLTVTGPDNQIAILGVGTILMLTDCNTAHIFSVSALNPDPPTSPVVLTHGLTVTPGIDNQAAVLAGTNYDAGSQILAMNTSVFYIGKSKSIPTPAGQAQINSLYRASTLQNNGNPEELVPYVQDMQLLYSVDTNDDLAPDVYKTAAEIAADGDNMLADVYSVNIALLVAGDIDVEAPDMVDMPDDGKLRKRYTRLVNIRNAGLATY